MRVGTTTCIKFDVMLRGISVSKGKAIIIGADRRTSNRILRTVIIDFVNNNIAFDGVVGIQEYKR